LAVGLFDHSEKGFSIIVLAGEKLFFVELVAVNA
jgi:hypothetical protein